MSILFTKLQRQILRSTDAVVSPRRASTFSKSPGPFQHRQAPAPASVEHAELLANYISIAPGRPLNLSTLLSFGRPVTPHSVLASVKYALVEIPRRLATRVRSLEALPFIVGTNPYIAKTLDAYRESFLWFAKHPAVTTLEENARFAKQLEKRLEIHTNDIPTMAKGFQECMRYLSPTQIGAFLDGAIRSRISVRLIAEQHIAISDAMLIPDVDVSYVGVVDPNCSPMTMVNMCGAFVTDLCNATLGKSPKIIVDGFTDATFPYVSVHLEYILTEIFKNSFRATMENHYKHHSGSCCPVHPVIITLSPPPSLSNSHEQPRYFSLRIRDQGGGISLTNMGKVFSYAFTTASRRAGDDLDDSGPIPYVAQYMSGLPFSAGGSGDANLFGEITGKGVQMGLGTIAGLGYGLPMSQLYARYFGGSLELMTLEGWGTDVFLKLRCLDEAGDATI